MLLPNDSERSGAPSPLHQYEELITRDPKAAAAGIRDWLRGNPLSAAGYRLLAEALDRADRASGTAGQIKTVVRASDPLLARAAHAIAIDDLETAEIILRRRLLERPSDVDALHLMAKFASALDYDDESQDLLEYVLELAPARVAARLDLAAGLQGQNRLLEAAEAVEPILAKDPYNREAKALRASALGRSGRLQEASKLHEELLEFTEDDPKLWTSYGHLLKTMGQSDLGLKAMRQAVAIAPHSGEAWWNLSNLKTVRFSDDEVAAMESALNSKDISDTDRFHFHFALGKAFEDAKKTDEAFAHYDRANAIRRRSLNYDPRALTAEVDSYIHVFSREFFERRPNWGSGAADPIFIVGMPRAGSTLIEQVLASHPMVEGTSELPNIPMIAKKLGRGEPGYLEAIERTEPNEFVRLGDEYIQKTRVHRFTERPHFVDKMPNNWLHVPLIHLLLPNAKIIDARRHPLACGFSNFKQHYVQGHGFSFDLATIGRQYRDYVRLMAHVDDILPGRVHRVIHETLVSDTEHEIRRMLDYLKLPFDESCLRFYETDRAVRTPSSEQVRRPISKEGVEQWRAFDQWLDPLKKALGPVLEAYPDVPDFS